MTTVTPDPQSADQQSFDSFEVICSLDGENNFLLFWIPHYWNQKLVTSVIPLKYSKSMPLTAAMRPLLARPCYLLRVSQSFRVCYHELPQSSTTKGNTPISVAASFSDDFESSPSVSQPDESKNKWDETLATLSEASVSRLRHLISSAWIIV